MPGSNIHYSMLIRWEPDEQIYVVTVPELPGSVTYGATYEERVRLGMDAIDARVMGLVPSALPKPNFYSLDDTVEDAPTVPAPAATPAS